MIQGKWFRPGEDLSSEVLPVRRAVFGPEESAGMSGNTESNTDPAGWNTLVFLDGHPAASGRIWWEDGAFWLGKIGVLPGLRGQGLGDLVLRLLLFKAQSHAAMEVRLRCPADTVGFFARLGFRPVSGTSGLVEMMIPGEDISLDSCENCKKPNCPNRKLP